MDQCLRLTNLHIVYSSQSQTTNILPKEKHPDWFCCVGQQLSWRDIHLWRSLPCHGHLLHLGQSSPNWLRALVRRHGWSIVPVSQGCDFDPQSGHIQESTNECISKWNNESMSLSPPTSLPSSLKSIKLLKNPYIFLRTYMSRSMCRMDVEPGCIVGVNT